MPDACPVAPRATRSPERLSTPAAAGQGRLAVALVDGSSTVVGCVAASPLHLFTPRPRGPAVSAMVASHGGGLVAGDTLDLRVDVGSSAVAAVGSQAETKVYRSDGPWSALRVSARVGAGAALAVVPEPTSCFAEARYRQEQRFELAPDASLLLVDAVTPGRSARGERWAFHAYVARNEIAIGGRLVLRDAIRLVRGEGAPIERRMRGMELLATVVAVGPALHAVAADLLREIARLPADGAARVLAVASPLADGVHLRVATRAVEDGTAFLRETIAAAAQVFGRRALHRAC